MLWFVHIPDKLIDLSIEFRRWENGTNALNSGPELLHFQCNQVSGEFLAAEAKLRSGRQTKKMKGFGLPRSLFLRVGAA